MFSTSKRVIVNITSLDSDVASALRGYIETLTRVIHNKDAIECHIKRLALLLRRV